DKLKADFNLMYTTYYSNAYFGIRQCMQIDSLRYAIEYMPTELKNIAFTALMSAMSFSVTSTTHFAQFLKVKNEKNYINVKSKNNNTSNNHKVFNKDFKEVLLDKSVKNSDISLIYADPPYFKEHYSRYYHLIESLVIYDYPELTFNPRINTVTVGRYPKDRIISDFGKKSYAPLAFKELAKLSSELGAELFISYSDNSIVDLSSIVKVCSKYYSK